MQSLCRWAVAVPMLLLVGPLLAQEESPEAKQAQARIAEFLDRCAGLQQEGKLKEALATAEQALHVAEEELGAETPDTAACLGRVADLRMGMGDPKGARLLLERGLAVYEKTRGPDHLDTGVTLHNLAYVCQKMGDLEAARPRYVRTLAIYEKAGLAEREEMATCLDDLAGLLLVKGDSKGAMPLCERALAIREKVLGPENDGTVVTMCTLAFLSKETGDLGRAKTLYERALATFEKTLAPDDEATAKVLHNLAGVLRELGDLEGARSSYERAIAIKEKRLGASAPETALSLGGLATVLLALGDTKGARASCDRALAINEKARGAGHPETALNLMQLASVLQAEGDLDRAKALDERALTILQKTRGPEHRDTASCLNNLATVCSQMGDLKGARPLLERVLAIREKALGPGHPETATSLCNLASLLAQLGDKARARSLYERALPVVERTLGAEHPRAAQVLENLAMVLHAEGDSKGARAHGERALAILEKSLGLEHPQTLLGRTRLGFLFQAGGDLKGARVLFERSLAETEKVHGPDHPRTAMCLNNLASVVEATGDRAGARTLLERSLAICERALGAEDPATAQVHANLALLLVDMGDREAALPHAERAWNRASEDLRLLLPALSGTERRALVQDRTIQLHAWLSVVHTDPSRAYDAVLVWKGAALRVDSAMLRLPPGASAEAREAARRLAEGRRALATLATSSPAERSTSSGEHVQALAVEVGRLERELGGLVPDLAARAFREVRTADVLAVLPEGVALLDIVESQGFLHAWVLREGRAVAYACLGRAEELEAQCERFRTALETDDRALWLESGGALRSRLNLDAVIKGVSELYVSPDGALATVPLGLLPDGERFLFERMPVVGVISGSALALAAREWDEGAGALLAIGGVDYDAAQGASGRGLRPEHPWPALVATLPEAKAVADRFRARFPETPCRLLDGKAATEGAFGREAPGARFVHVATHGYFDLKALRAAFAPAASRGFSGRIEATLDPTADGAPTRATPRGWNPLLLSGLVLAGANAGDGGEGADGWLTSEELQDLDLRGVELVVLSACETGRGDLAAGEGVLGLSRALSVAGAGGFVLSLWKVPDAETSDLMGRFYDVLWAEGQTPGSALRAAQLHALDRDRAAGRFRPSTWSAWVLTR